MQQKRKLHQGAKNGRPINRILFWLKAKKAAGDTSSFSSSSLAKETRLETREVATLLETVEGIEREKPVKGKARPPYRYHLDGKPIQIWKERSP